MKITAIAIGIGLISAASIGIYFRIACSQKKEIFRLLEEARPDANNLQLTLQQQNAIGEKTAAHIVSLLSDYSYANDLDATLRFFLKESLNISITPENIHTSWQGSGEGMSGNLITKVDTANHPIIIKVYRKERSEIEFFEEISTMHGIQELGLKHIKSPRILALGKCTINNRQYLLLAQEYAPGKTIKDILVQGFLGNSTNHTRAVAQKAISALGSGLAELHYAHTGIVSSIHPLFIEACGEIYKAAAHIIAAHPEYDIDQKALNAYFTNALNGIQSIPITYGFMHTDTNLGNYIYDADSGTLFIIDVCHGVLSFAKGLTPIGMPGFDVVRVRDFILSLSGLSKEERLQVESWFIDAYIGAKGINPTAQETAFYELISCLQYIMWLGSDQEIRNRFLEQKFIWLKNTLNAQVLA